MDFIDLKTQYRRVRESMNARIQAVLEHGQFILGAETLELERRLAGYVGVEHCIGASSGTDTLLMARQRFPGQRNSLDALCKRLGVDNSHRQLHGALLDAQILADVYIALTSGQGEIGFDEGMPPPATVPQVDLARYMGRWYEIASYPQRFQKGCTDSRADYRIQDDGTVEVLNSCLRNGKIDRAKGKAWVVDKKTNAKMKVSFFWPFRGDYWIIELGRDYEYAVVSAPSRKYLWILSRTPKMEEQRYQEVVGRLKDRGFDITLLKRTEQGNRTDK